MAILAQRALYALVVRPGHFVTRTVSLEYYLDEFTFRFNRRRCTLAHAIYSSASSQTGTSLAIRSRTSQWSKGTPAPDIRQTTRCRGHRN